MNFVRKLFKQKQYKNNFQETTIFDDEIKELENRISKGKNIRFTLKDINFRNINGETFLHYSIRKNVDPQILINLLKRTDINVNLQDNEGNTPLMLAIIYNMKNIVIELLKKPNIELNLKDVMGNSALMIAVNRLNLSNMNDMQNKEDIIEILLNKNDIDVNLQDNKGFTVLMLVINNRPDTERTLAIVDKILGFSNIDVNLQNIYKNSALILAVNNNDWDVFLNLLKKPDIDVNLQDNTGNNALMYAIIQSKFYFIDEILKKSTNIKFNLKNNNGETALDLCKKFKLQDKYIIAMSGITDLCIFIENINKIIRDSINKKNFKNINNNVYNDIIIFLKDNYNLTSTYNNGITTINPDKIKGLLYIAKINNNNIFYKKIKVQYKTSTGNMAGINAGGLTRNFFFECQQQLNELFKYYLSNKKNNVISEKASSNLNSNKIKYYDELKKDFYWKNYIIVLNLLIFSKINNCPIYLDKELFSKLSQIILNLIIISNKYSLIQKIFIINMLQKYKDIFNKELYYGMYDLLLTERHRINMNNMNHPEKLQKQSVINTYISEINEAKKIKRNANNQEYMNKEMQQLKNNLEKDGNMGLSFTIEDAITRGIYKDLIDFYYTHFIPHIVTFETFMGNLKFHKGYSTRPLNNEEKFKNKIIELFKYMNEKDENNILLLAQAMTGNTLLASEYKINLYSRLAGNNAKAEPAKFHTCSNSVDFFEDNFPFVITSNNQTKNDENLKNFIHLLNTQIDSNFIG